MLPLLLSLRSRRWLPISTNDHAVRLSRAPNTEHRLARMSATDTVHPQTGLFIRPTDEANMYTTLEPTMSSNPNVYFQRGGNVHPGMMYWMIWVFAACSTLTLGRLVARSNRSSRASSRSHSDRLATHAQRIPHIRAHLHIIIIPQCAHNVCIIYMGMWCDWCVRVLSPGFRSSIDCFFFLLSINGIQLTM